MQVGENWWKVLIEQEIANSNTPVPITFPTGVTGTNLFSFQDNPHGIGDEPNAGFVAVAESIANHLEGEIGGRSASFMERIQFEDNLYIPDGLYWDLNDAMVDATVPDNISGFTRAQMFNSLVPNVASIPTYRDQLQPDLPPGNNLADYNTLLNFYTR